MQLLLEAASLLVHFIMSEKKNADVWKEKCNQKHCLIIEATSSISTLFSLSQSEVVLMRVSDSVCVEGCTLHCYFRSECLCVQLYVKQRAAMPSPPPPPRQPVGVGGRDVVCVCVCMCVRFWSGGGCAVCGEQPGV